MVILLNDQETKEPELFAITYVTITYLQMAMKSIHHHDLVTMLLLQMT